MNTGTNEQEFSGHPIVRGSALGQAIVLQPLAQIISDEPVLDSKKEWQQAEACFLSVDRDLEALEEKVRTEMGAEKAEIFAAHRQIAGDPEMQLQVKDEILLENKSASFAVQKIFDGFAEQFAAIDDAYLKERATDILDVKSRLLVAISGKESLFHLVEPRVIVAEDLAPSQFAALDKKKILALVTELGGETSHTAIMARVYNLPAVIGVKNLVHHLADGDWIAVSNGKVWLHPTLEKQAVIREKIKKEKIEREELEIYRTRPSTTADGTRLDIQGNIGRIEDLQAVLDASAAGIGLFRTEFLFLEKKTEPSEEEQFQVYKKMLAAFPNHPVTIRTLDIGGDKQIPYLHIGKEENPFLGLRALRYCLLYPEVFVTQLRALLRASPFGNLKIMFPMVSSLHEILEAKKILKSCEVQLRAEGHAFSSTYKVGIMIEIPAAAILADRFAPHVDFFSIGTNDLIQYTVAVDRMNETVKDLYQATHPAVLNLIQNVISVGENTGVEVSMCGEMASDLALVPLLAGMGLRHFSQSPASILRSKKLISTLKISDCVTLASRVSEQPSSEDVAKVLTMTSL